MGAILIPLLLQAGIVINGGVIRSGAGGGGGGGMVSFVQERGDPTHGACNSAGVAASITCAFSSAPTAGNTVVVSCITYNTHCTVSDNAGTDTYTQVTIANPNGSSTGTINSGCLESTDTHKVVCIWYSFNVAGSATIKGVVAANSYIILHQYEFSGMPTTASFDVVAYNSLDTAQSSSSVTSGATAQSNELLLNACAFEDAFSTITQGSGYTLGMVDNSVSTLAVDGAEQYSLSNSAGAQTATLTPNTTWASGYTCTIVTFKHS